MSKITQKEIILDYLKDAGAQWTPAYKLRSVNTPYGWIGHQGDRVCRKLAENKTIERCLIGRYAHYRTKQAPPFDGTREPPSIAERKKTHTYPSKTKRGIYYNAVETEYGLICDCPSYQFRHACKHIKLAEKEVMMASMTPLF